MALGDGSNSCGMYNWTCSILWNLQIDSVSLRSSPDAFESQKRPNPWFPRLEKIDVFLDICFHAYSYMT
jgi:hypothetical protein